MGAARPLPPSADIGPGGQSVGQAAQFCLVIRHIIGLVQAARVRTVEEAVLQIAHRLRD